MTEGCRLDRRTDYSTNSHEGQQGQAGLLDLQEYVTRSYADLRPA